MSSFAVEKLSCAAVCFADLEIVSVGLFAEQAAVRGMTVVTGVFPLAASDQATTLDEDAGFVRVVACHDIGRIGRIVGIQAVGSHVSELSGEFALAVEMAGLLRFSQHHPCPPDTQQGHARGDVEGIGTGDPCVTRGYRSDGDGRNSHRSVAKSAAMKSDTGDARTKPMKSECVITQNMPRKLAVFRPTHRSVEA